MALAGILFDFDATLGIAEHDRAGAHRAMFRELASDGYGGTLEAFEATVKSELAALNRRRMETEVEPTFDAYYGQVLRALGLEPTAERLETWRGLLLERHQFTLYPSTEATLEALRERGYRLGVVSNAIHGTTTRTLEQLGLAPRFEVIVESCFVGLRKPARAFFELGLAGLGTDAASTMSVGNSPYFDIAEPQRMGMTTVWVRTELSYREPKEGPAIEPDYAVDELSEILPIVERVGR